MKIAVDAMGGDYAPEEIVLGAIEAVKAYDYDVVLVGDETKIRQVLTTHGAKENERLSIVHASEVIEMGEHPAQAIRRKKDASIVVAARLVKDGACDAVVAAGSTGAAVTAALFELGRIKGIERPCIATPIPSKRGLLSSSIPGPMPAASRSIWSKAPLWAATTPNTSSASKSRL